MGQSHLQERGVFRTGKTKQRVLSVKTPGWQHCDARGQLHKTAPCGNSETLHYREELPNEFNESEEIGISKGIARCIRALMHTMNISQGDAINLLCVSEDDIPEVLEQLRPLS